MNTPFFISWRYQRAKQKNRLVSLISLFSIFTPPIQHKSLYNVFVALSCVTCKR